VTEYAVLKGIAQWVLERASEFVLGSLFVGLLLLFLLGFADNTFWRGSNIFSSLLEALQMAAIFIIYFYLIGLFFVTTIIHNIITKKTEIKLRAISLSVCFSFQFSVFVALIFGSDVFLDSVTFLMVLSSLIGGLLAGIIVNTTGTRLFQRLLKIRP